MIVWWGARVGYGLIAWGYYLIAGYDQDQRMFYQQVKEFSNYRQVQPIYQAADLQIQPAAVFSSANDRYDFVALAGNPNERWIAYLSYKFTYDGGETPVAEMVALPLRESPLGYLGQELSGYPLNVSLVVEDLKWRRVSPHLIDDAEGYLNERLNFYIDNFKFTPESRSAGVPANIIEFDLTNNTPYSFWEPKFYVEFLNGGMSVGFISLSLEKLLTAETRHIDLRSLSDNLSISDIKIYPVFDVFAEKEYIKPL